MDISEIIEIIVNHNVIKVIFVVFCASLLQIGLRLFANSIAHRMIKRHRNKMTLEERKREATLSGAFKTLAGLIIWISVIVIILNILNVDVSTLLTGAGLIGIVVGFGAQNTIKDMLAGIFVIAENQYRVGDIITINAVGGVVSGTVEDITIRITKLRDLDGYVHIVKNGSVEIVTNLSFHYANVNINLDVAYSSDIDLVEKIINEVGQSMVDENAPLKVHIYEPIKFLRVHSFEASSVSVKALGKVEPAKQWEVSGAFLREIKKAFDKNGIEIPFNQIVVHESK